MKYLYLDTEYNNPRNKDMGLICAAVYIDGVETVYWTRHEDEKQALINVLNEAKQTRTIVCFSASAEARAFVALGLDPLEFTWIDLYLDFKQLLNNDYFYLYNKYISEVTVAPKKGDLTAKLKKTVIKESRGFMKDMDRFYTKEELEEEILDHTKACNSHGFTQEKVGANLINACIRFVPNYEEIAVADKDNKKDTLALILRDINAEFTSEEEQQIREYCANDTHYLETIMNGMGDALAKRAKQNHTQVLENRIRRGRVGVCMAVMESNGTPVRVDLLESIRDNAQMITDNAKSDFNQEHLLPLYQMKTLGKKSNQWRFDGYSKKSEVLEKFIDDKGWKWGRSKKTGKYTTDEASMKKFKSNPVIKQIMDITKLSSAMNIMQGKGKSSSTLQMCGDDGKVRTSLMPYGTQTFRNAPKASSFIFAQGGWVRSTIAVPKNRTVVEVDYSSQEYWIGAVMGNDEKMKQAYHSNDVYIAFGHGAGEFEKDFPKATMEDLIKLKKEGNPTIKKIRDNMKPIVLGLGFGMGIQSLVDQTERPYDEIADLVGKYKELYSDYYDWREEMWEDHKDESTPPITLWNGSYLGKHADNKLSMQNFPVQGTGSCMLHEALSVILSCPRLKELNVELMTSLHDAVYFTCDTDTKVEASELVKKYLIEASDKVLGEKGMRAAVTFTEHGEYMGNYPMWKKVQKLINWEDISK